MLLVLFVATVNIQTVLLYMHFNKNKHMQFGSFGRYIKMVGRHGAAVVCTVASQQEGHGSEHEPGLSVWT